MQRTHVERAPAMKGFIAMNWIIRRLDGQEILWHNGGTGGYRTFAGYNPATKVGIVALSNTSTPAGVDDIGRHLLDSGFPLAPPVKPPKDRKEITLDPKILARYPGKYELAPTFHITVTLEDGKLFLQATAQPKFPLFAEAEKEFFLKVVDAQITFEVDGDGPATKLVLHQNGRDLPGKRTE
jgi:D-alanyl-D-alanine-carboxypeptidase/D-alanyl-D-alanine-endopeptidase